MSRKSMNTMTTTNELRTFMLDDASEVLTIAYILSQKADAKFQALPRLQKKSFSS